MKKQLFFIPLILIAAYSANAQTILGVDVNAGYGSINWQQVKTADKTFAWTKATQGIDFADTTLETNITNGTSAGVTMGAYHYATPETNDPVSEATFFLGIAGQYIGAGYLPPVLDLEDPISGPLLHNAFTRDSLTAWVQTWLTTVQNGAHVAPIIYTDATNSAYLDSSLNTYRLWIVDIDNNPANPPTANLGVWTTWAFKQYSFSGTVSGISSSVNLDVFNGDNTAFDSLISRTSAIQPALTTPHFNIYPNPADNVAIAKLDNTATLDVTDCLGQKILIAETTGLTEYYLPVHNWAHGVYFVTAASANGLMAHASLVVQ